MVTVPNQMNDHACLDLDLPRRLCSVSLTGAEVLIVALRSYYSFI
jgi:hypothetical protein